MKTYSAAVLAALAANELPLVTLVRMDFVQGTVALNNSNMDFVYGGVTYKGASGLGAIAPITDGGGEPGGIKLELNNFDPAFISLAMDDMATVQGTPIEIRTAILDKDTYAILDAPLDWRGRADVMSLAETMTSGSVGLSAESKGVDLLRGNPSLYNDADQQSRWPGDRAYEYVEDQSTDPVVWPMRAWFFR